MASTEPPARLYAVHLSDADHWMALGSPGVAQAVASAGYVSRAYVPEEQALGVVEELERILKEGINSQAEEAAAEQAVAAYREIADRG